MCIRDSRHHRSRCHGHHRRVERLPRYRRARLPPRPAQPTRRTGARRGHRRAAARRAPDRVTGETVAVVYPSRRGRSRSSAWIPQRVLVPVQPAPLEQPRAGVPARAATGRRPRSCPLHPTRRPSRAEEEAADATRPSGPSTQPGPATRRTPVAAHTVDESSRFRWIALRRLCRRQPVPRRQ